jgi:4-amino-4-deoxy-L-arabinose transferase-like glycosyltransferase
MESISRGREEGTIEPPPPALDPAGNRAANIGGSLWLAFLAFAVLGRIIPVCGASLEGHDEPRVAGIAREMVLSGDWLIPRLNGRPFLEYPPLGYLPVAAALALSHGSSEEPTVLPAAILGLATVLLTVLLGKAMAGGAIGLWAGAILSMTPGFFFLERRCLVDPTLVFFITLSLYGFAAGYRASRNSFAYYSLFYLSMGLAFLSKGLIGPAVPAATVVVFLIARRDFSAVKKLRPVRGALLALLPLALWAGGLWRREGPDLLGEVVRQSLWRFFSSSPDHAGPFYYYLVPCLVSLLPWTFLPLAGFWLRRGTGRRPEEESVLRTFAWCWFFTVFLGLSLASAKRTLYLGPIYPAFALFSALHWKELLSRFPRLRFHQLWLALAFLLLISWVQFGWLLPRERLTSYRSAFAAVGPDEGGRSVCLYQPTEATRGAAVFYLGRTVPVISTEGDLSAWLDDPSARVLITSPPARGDPLPERLSGRRFVPLLRAEVGKRSLLVYGHRF